MTETGSGRLPITFGRLPEVFDWLPEPPPEVFKVLAALEEQRASLGREGDESWCALGWPLLELRLDGDAPPRSLLLQVFILLIFTSVSLSAQVVSSSFIRY